MVYQIKTLFGGWRHLAEELGPSTHTAEPGGIPGSQCQPGPALAAVGIWGVDGNSLSLFVPFSVFCLLNP